MTISLFKSVSMRALLCGAVFSAALMAGGYKSQADAASFTEAQKNEMHQIIRDYLVNNPETVIEALEAFQANQREAEARQFGDRFSQYLNGPEIAEAPTVGNPDGDVTIIEFVDYNCGYCKQAFRDVQRLLGEDDNVKVVFIEYPILSQSSTDAARYALAAERQGQYFEFHQALMTLSGQKNEGTYRRIADNLGLDFEQLQRDANDREIQAVVTRNIEMARNLGIRGTPAFIIDENLYPGYIGYDGMVQLVNDARQDEE